MRAHLLSKLGVLALLLSFASESVLAGPFGEGAEIDVAELKPVDFELPPSAEGWEYPGGQFLIRFIWEPEEGLEPDSILGEFNSWNRGDFPFTDEDNDGIWQADALIGDGLYRYKFTSKPDGWHTDPNNPDMEPDGHGGQNSILYLGLSAALRGVTGERGDGVIHAKALMHDPDKRTYYDVVNEREVIIRLTTLKDDVDQADLVLIQRDTETRIIPMNLVGGDDYFDFYELYLSLNESEKEISIGYSFQLVDGRLHQLYGRDPGWWPILLDKEQIIYVPNWAADSIWYQIFPDRFRNGSKANDPGRLTGSSTDRTDQAHPWNSEWYDVQPYEKEDPRPWEQWSMWRRLYGGDIQGIAEKLDYLERLGVTALYLNPVFEAASPHKYDGRSYVHVDDGFGVAGEFDPATKREDMKDAATWEFNKSDKLLLDLAAQLNQRGMHIIIDGVFNHLGDDSVPFLDVKLRREESPFADWFDVTNWDPFEYVGWAGFGQLPEFKKDADGLEDDSLEEHIFAVTRRWLDPNGDGDPRDGVDGWRLDVPFELPDTFWARWRNIVKEANPEAYTVAEIWEPAEHYLDGKHFDAVMNYPFAKAAFAFFGDRENKITATEFDRRLARHRARYPWRINLVLQNLYDSHDTDRWVSRLANPDKPYDNGGSVHADDKGNYTDARPDAEAYQRMKLMALFQAGYVGAPMIYYGTEIGMFGADDPHNRLPMWWADEGPYKNPEYREEPGLIDEFRHLFAMRKEFRSLRRGLSHTLLTDDGADLYAFMRWLPPSESAGKATGDESLEPVLIILNNSSDEQEITIPFPAFTKDPALPAPAVPAHLGFTRARHIYGEGAQAFKAERDAIRLTLPPISGAAVAVAIVTQAPTDPAE